jgi:hypothetical protein
MRRPLVLCAVLAGAALVAPAPALARQSHPQVTVDCGSAAHRPRAMQTCGIDFSDSFRRLHWTSWGNAVARGRGRWLPGCQAQIGVSCPPERRATVRLSRPTSCGPYVVFSRLRVRSRGSSTVIDLSCPPARASAAQDPAACDASSPPAERLAVPRRLSYSESAKARLVRLPGAATVQQATIQVGARKPVTVVRDGERVPEDVFVGQKLDAPPVVVRLVASESRGGALCRRTLERTVHGFRHIEAAQGCFSSRYKPRQIFTCEVNNGNHASGVHWGRWNRDVARGHGRWLPTCSPLPGPTCAPAFDGDFALSRIRYCAQYGSFIYTRLRVSPDRGGRTSKARLPCPQIATGGE